jgi:ATP-dependent Lon protease
VREKVLAAQRARLKRVILPRENEPDLDELAPETRDALTFVLADELPDVLEAALNGTPPRTRSRVSSDGTNGTTRRTPPRPGPAGRRRSGT